MPLQKFIVQVGARCIEAIYTRYNSGLINPPFLKATMKHGRSEHHGENNNFHGAIFTFLRESFHFPIRHFFVTKFVTHITKLVTHVRKFVTRITKFVTNFFCIDRKKYQGESGNLLLDSKNCKAGTNGGMLW